MEDRGKMITLYFMFTKSVMGLEFYFYLLLDVVFMLAALKVAGVFG